MTCNGNKRFKETTVIKHRRTAYCSPLIAWLSVVLVSFVIESGTAYATSMAVHSDLSEINEVPDATWHTSSTTIPEYRVSIPKYSGANLSGLSRGDEPLRSVGLEYEGAGELSADTDLEGLYPLGLDAIRSRPSVPFSEGTWSYQLYLGTNLSDLDRDNWSFASAGIGYNVLDGVSIVGIKFSF